MYIKPQDGRQVPDPERGDVLPTEGRNVENNQYWQRRIADGDVAEAEPPQEAAAPVPQADASASTKTTSKKD